MSIVSVFLFEQCSIKALKKSARRRIAVFFNRCRVQSVSLILLPTTSTTALTGTLIGMSSLALPASATIIISKPPATTVIVIAKLLAIALPLTLPATTMATTVIVIAKLLAIALPLTLPATTVIATVALRRSIATLAAASTVQHLAKGIHERLALGIAAPTGLLLHHFHYIHHTLRGVVLIRLHNGRYRHRQNRQYDAFHVHLLLL
ncbi:MAG: hypothetical protein EKK69_06685 [Candidatus Competibacteraceae bacterium]|nr:MAG: hypothetical protein EKK69_06685 [Candidatus Competibacteraceae bacterium]